MKREERILLSDRYIVPKRETGMREKMRSVYHPKTSKIVSERLVNIMSREGMRTTSQKEQIIDVETWSGFIFLLRCTGLNYCRRLDRGDRT